MDLICSRRRMLLAAASLLAAMPPRNSAKADTDFRAVSGITPIIPPAPLPDLAFTTLDGRPASLASYKGKPLVLNFWATWCDPCIAELPELDQLAASGMAVIAASADRTGAKAVAPFLAKHPLAHATVLLDPGSDAVHQVRVVGFPTTLVIDAEFRLRGRLEGPAHWGAALDAVRHLVG